MLKKAFVRIVDLFLDAIQLYPLSMLLIAVGFSVLQLLNWMPYEEWTNDTLEQLSLTIWVVLPLFTVVSLFKLRKWTLILALLLGFGFYFYLDQPLYTSGVEYKVGLWGLAFYGLLFALPMWKKDNNNGFWQYCGRLAFVLCLGLVVSLILGLSLQLFLFSLETLFDVSVDFRWTSSAWQFAFCLVLPIFAHIGLPVEWKELERSKTFPFFLKPISYYLLMPIALLYFCILAAYVVRILLTQTWPSGEVAYPTLFFTVLVFASYFLSYPWRKEWFKLGFLSTLPFLVVYFVSLFQRIEQYGLTEMRILGVLLGTVLFGLALYYYFSKAKRFQTFFLTFAVVAFVFSLGPWGIFQLSLNSQKARLEEALMEIGGLENGVLHLVDANNIPSETVREISFMVEFFVRRDRMDVLQEWTTVDLKQKDEYGYSDAGMSFMNLMGLEYNFWDDYRVANFFEYSVRWQSSYDVEGYEDFFTFDLGVDAHFKGDIEMQTRSFMWDSAEENVNLVMDDLGELVLTVEGAELTFNFHQFVVSLKGQSFTDPWNLAPSDLMMEAENDELRARIYFENLNGTLNEDESLDSFWVNGKLLLDHK